MSEFTVPAFKRLLSIELDEFADVESYVDEFMALARGLEDNGYVIGEPMLVALLLMGLPVSCDSLVQDVESSKMSLEAAKTRILRDVRMMQEEFEGSRMARESAEGLGDGGDTD